jgi:tetratricopeptide (TPR) repeat protein
VSDAVRSQGGDAGGRGDAVGTALRLEVLDFDGPSQWRWRLTDTAGGFLADHQVELDATAWQFEAFQDMHRFLQWNAAPDRRLAHEAELMEQVGDWIGGQVLGPVAAVLARERRLVRLEVPAKAAVLGYRPWELARVEGRTLAAHRVSVIIDQQPHRPRSKAKVGDRLRMLAVFSLPEDAGALNLRKERFELARLVHQIAAVNNKAIELRVLQYGATRQRLEDALLEQPGWDVVHLSGHGLPAGLILEDDTGRHDLISSTELVDLLDLAADQIKLVTLSACESAAVTAREHLQLLGLASATKPAAATDRDESVTAVSGDSAGPDDGGGSSAWGRAGEGDGGWLPAVAAELVARLDCAVLAMRFPVIDDFAVALADSFYGLVLGKGQPVPRALAFSLPKVAPVPPTPGAPALSVGTPTLFGARAVGLSLVPPPGGPVTVAAERQKLAGFPPQPVRFVGRVGPMTRATTALAPRSGRVGVVFHGMAGGGKTACALELAYTHQESFPLLAWHAAPPEGHDITTALSDFALALERQLPGLKLAHLVTDIATLRDHLPGLTEVVEQNRVLIVLDNIESLLTDAGQWRDERWDLLVDALTAHRGLSRLVLTSRIRPAQLDGGLLVEAVHALSLRESVLLAREWPHLCSLVDGTGLPAELTVEAARDLAARTLAVVQGHPKLIELADGHANDPAALTARLEEADRTWLTQGTRLESFLATGEPTATDQDYLTVLQGWARSTASALPDIAATFFRFLAYVEEEDRDRPVVDGTWADLWRRLERLGDPPDPDMALAPLVEQALVAADLDPDTGRAVRYRIHPGVAEAARSGADPDFAAAVDTELAGYWLATLVHAVGREEEMGWLVRRTARSAAPYLLRQHHWDGLDFAARVLLDRDSSTATAAALLPLLATAVGGTRGTDLELSLGRSYARALRPLHPDEGETQLRQLLEIAIEQQRFDMATLLAGDLIPLYVQRGWLDEAMSLVDRRAEYIRRAGHGPWSQLRNQARRLLILHRQGHQQQVLDTGQQLRDQMADLPDPPDDNDSTVLPWNVGEMVLNTMVLAARDLGQWQHALDLNREVKHSERRRGASDAQQAVTAFSDCGPLLRLGRVNEARELLIGCRDVFEATNDIIMLGNTLSALAQVEDRLGHPDRAVDLEKDALRFSYLAGESDNVAASHHNLAYYLDRGNHDRQQVGAHRLAAAQIGYEIGSGRFTSRLAALGGLLAQGRAAVPVSFTELCDIVDHVPGVHLADLLSRLPVRTADPQTAIDEVLRLAQDAAAAAELVTGWDPVLSALDTAASHPDPDTRHAANQALDGALTAREQQAEWQALTAVLRRIHTGERGPATLLPGLDPIDTAIAQRTLDHLNGNPNLGIHPDAWHSLTDTTDDAGGGGS